MASIYIRKAQASELEQVFALISQGKKLLAQDQIPQWQGEYPQKADIQQDIDKGETYLLILDAEIVGTATLFQANDPNYEQIYQGQWQPSDKKYATIHRITVAPQYHGQHLADFFFSNLTSEAYRLGFREVRIDTHAMNQRMQHVILKQGFSYSGIVYMDGDQNDQRNVYQLFLG
ncbi:GNAT family acetyltransferase [Ligilactobacillus salitolerans]|uniref:GNAT family acetyltransferase n=1 Tax=Ligilactobacillus salitolerans TaxID=1808352 RepID=A0A401IWI3_9LACO|nr:GNAT family N-acetyltransferase [Ligilactobacillus salitolerans]GBG95868.1 GNAT family acetyltransferase [Ligilactobacillus salitolerans]